MQCVIAVVKRQPVLMLQLVYLHFTLLMNKLKIINLDFLFAPSIAKLYTTQKNWLFVKYGFPHLLL